MIIHKYGYLFYEKVDVVMTAEQLIREYIQLFTYPSKLKKEDKHINQIWRSGTI
ncbi:hypothetical protein [Sporosarcina limicola]|uniref:Uncharacterized protein n=1 Tax=Sporosarcina limicola TaxID=34101 RepID=A0A927MJD9_9BACL|nr:hypothetical protein [Sporosarcina limicola]MBE1554052.1 hypothetical protein [Sporosarcina limicola]